MNILKSITFVFLDLFLLIYCNKITFSKEIIFELLVISHSNLFKYIYINIKSQFIRQKLNKRHLKFSTKNDKQ